MFDGAEKRNVARNHDELRLWREYLDNPKDASWLCDDQGRCGGLPADARFVILGDLNNDPVDGAGRHDAIRALITHPRVLQYPTPHSAGGPEKTAEYAAQGVAHAGDPHQVTGDFGPQAGTMRLDYVLPSRQFTLVGSGIFWPASATPEAAIADGSDHHAVWVDVAGGR
nr:endonuclease/exonuclease/phosphatase family protein [Xanthomonas arboricola]